MAYHVAGVLPVLYLILVDLASQPLLVPCVLAAVAGTVVVIAGPNIRAQIMNVNGPDTIGLALALHATLDDVGEHAFSIELYLGSPKPNARLSAATTCSAL